MSGRNDREDGKGNRRAVREGVAKRAERVREQQSWMERERRRKKKSGSGRAEERRTAPALGATPRSASRSAADTDAMGPLQRPRKRDEQKAMRWASSEKESWQNSSSRRRKRQKEGNGERCEREKERRRAEAGRVCGKKRQTGERPRPVSRGIPSRRAASFRPAPPRWQPKRTNTRRGGGGRAKEATANEQTGAQETKRWAKQGRKKEQPPGEEEKRPNKEKRKNACVGMEERNGAEKRKGTKGTRWENLVDRGCDGSALRLVPPPLSNPSDPPQCLAFSPFHTRAPLLLLLLRVALLRRARTSVRRARAGRRTDLPRSERANADKATTSATTRREREDDQGENENAKREKIHGHDVNDAFASTEI